MVRSMTGYGRGEYKSEDRHAVVEISSVNHRYLDTNIKLAKSIVSIEDTIRNRIKQDIARGKVEIYINYTSKSKEDYSIDFNEGLCKEYVDTLCTIRDRFTLKDDISTMAVAKFPGIIDVKNNADNIDIIENLILNALEDAIISFNKMRSVEGELLKSDLLLKATNIDNMIKEIKERFPSIIEQYKQNLRSKIENMLGDMEIDESRLLTEVAILADKSSIDEEITRLVSHVHQLRDTLEQGGVIGRKLDFLIQEINREINTIGSKSNDNIVSKIVIDLKSEVEKIREQIQNIE